MRLDSMMGNGVCVIVIAVCARYGGWRRRLGRVPRRGGRLAYLCCAWQYSALSSWNSIEVGTSRHSVLVGITIAIHIELGMVTGLDRVTWMSFSLRNTCSSSDHHKSTTVEKDRLVTICSIFATFNSPKLKWYSTWHLTSFDYHFYWHSNQTFFFCFTLYFPVAFAISINQLYTNTFTQDTLFHQQRIKLLLRNAGCRNLSWMHSGDQSTLSRVMKVDDVAENMNLSQQENRAQSMMPGYILPLGILHTSVSRKLHTLVLAWMLMINSEGES